MEREWAYVMEFAVVFQGTSTAGAYFGLDSRLLQVYLASTGEGRSSGNTERAFLSTRIAAPLRHLWACFLWQAKA